MSKTKKLPNFKTEAKEREFWETHDSTDYVDWTKAQATTLPNVKPSTKTISLSLPASLLESIKAERSKQKRYSIPIFD